MDTIAVIIAAISIIIAGYGAVLSTIVLVRRIRDDRFDVFVSHGYSYERKNLIRGNDPDALTISAVNRGKRELKSTILGIDIPDYCIITPTFLDEITNADSENNKCIDEKITLKPGDKIEASFDYKHLTIFLVNNLGRELPCRIRPVYEDTLENVFCGTWFELGGED